MPQIHCKISGRVQGVFFRAATEREARELKLTGWVKNCPDGSVECVADGPRETLEIFLQWLSHGPPAAKVSQVDTQWSDSTDRYHNFSII